MFREIFIFVTKNGWNLILQKCFYTSASYSHADGMFQQTKHTLQTLPHPTTVFSDSAKTLTNGTWSTVLRKRKDSIMLKKG